MSSFFFTFNKYVKITRFTRNIVMIEYDQLIQCENVFLCCVRIARLREVFYVY